MNDRPIEELLALDTYQGMTDSEIESLIEYRVGQRVASAEFQAQVDANNAASNAIIEQHREYYARVNGVFETIAAMNPVLEQVVLNG